MKDFLIGQTHIAESPFEVIDGSLKEAAPEKDWEEKAKVRIRVADLVIVLVGRTTHQDAGRLYHWTWDNLQKILR